MANTHTKSMNEGIHSVNEQLQIIRSTVEHLVMILDMTEEVEESLTRIVDAIDECSKLLDIDMMQKHEDPCILSADNVSKKKGSKILIIEDEEEIAEIYSSNLEYFGFKPFIASTFLEGMKIIQSENIDIVILDIMLPDAYGLDCIDSILSKNKDIKIVVATGKLDELKQDLSHLEGKCTILTKPFSIRALLAAIL